MAPTQPGRPERGAQQGPRHGPHTGVTEADLLLEAGRALRHTWADAFTELGLTPHEGRALRVVVEHTHDGVAPRLADVAAALRIAPRSATEVVDRLQERALVERRPSATDRRAVEVAPTDPGIAVHARMETARREAAERFLAPLATQDRLELARLLRALASPAS